MTAHGNYIGGRWTDGPGQPNRSPSNTDDVIGDYAWATPSDMAQATAAAKAAFPAWSRTGLLQRHDILLSVAAELTARSGELGQLLAREEGKTLIEATGEVATASQIFRFFAGEVLRLSGERLASTRPGVDVEITREPVGVIGIITPWNFPIAIPAWKIAPALAFGNCVVFKPAELTPGSAWALSDILVRSGIPDGVFNLVMGRGSVIGDTLVNSPEVDAITFTGSDLTGRRVAAACAPAFRKVQLEMGGKNPLIVLDDADLDVAADCAVSGSFLLTGQRCTASSRLIVTEAVHDRFVDAVVDRLKTMTVDDALKDGTRIGPVVDGAQLEKDLDFINSGISEGAHLVWGGACLNRETRGYYLQPALFTETTPQMRINREEIFGPVAAVQRVGSYEEALAVANDTPYGLSAGLCTTSLKHASHFKRNAEAGMVMVNLPTGGVDPHVPFGGRKGSSYGSREQGRYAAEFFTTVKTAYTRP